MLTSEEVSRMLCLDSHSLCTVVSWQTQPLIVNKILQVPWCMRSLVNHNKGFIGSCVKLAGYMLLITQAEQGNVANKHYTQQSALLIE